MNDNEKKSIVPRNNFNLTAKISTLAKRGLETITQPSKVQGGTTLSVFLDSVGGIPDNNRDMRFQDINRVLVETFSRMSMDEISKELDLEYQKRPNGRVLKLLGFSYFNSQQFDKAIATLMKTLSNTSEDPVGIYEVIGQSYILQRNIDEAKKWYTKSYRFDFDFFYGIFGFDFLYITALGRSRRRSPIFGEGPDEFCDRALLIEMLADAMSMVYGNIKGHIGLVNDGLGEVKNLANEYASNYQRVNEDINYIKETTAELIRLANNSMT